MVSEAPVRGLDSKACMDDKLLLIQRAAETSANSFRLEPAGKVNETYLSSQTSLLNKRDSSVSENWSILPGRAKNKKSRLF